MLFTDEMQERFEQPESCPEDCSFYRVYGGTGVDLCAIRSGSNGGLGGALLTLDLPFSFITDTLVLPYTIYQQATLGGSHTMVTGKKSKCAK